MFRPLVTFPFAQQHHTTVHAYSPSAAVTSSRPLVTFAQQTTVWKTGSNGLESTVRPLVWISLGLSTTTVWCGVVSVGREMVGCGSALLPHWNQIGAVSVWILAHYQVYVHLCYALLWTTVQMRGVVEMRSWNWQIPSKWLLWHFDPLIVLSIQFCFTQLLITLWPSFWGELYWNVHCVVPLQVISLPR